MSRLGTGAMVTGQSLRSALALSPADGHSWRDIGLLDRLASAFSRAVLILADDPDVQGGLAGAALSAGDHRSAGPRLRRALALAPGRADLLQLASHLAYCRHLPGEAVRWARRALAYDRNFLAARRSLHFGELLGGDVGAGIAVFGADLRSVPSIPLPLWRGEPMAGRALLVVGEEGFGDMIQMARFLPGLARTGARVTVVVPPQLQRLFGSIDGVTVAIDASPAHFDAWIPMMALPAVMPDAFADGIPKPPYLAPPDQGPELASPHQFTVGLAWAGRANHPFDRQRSLARDALSPLLAVPGVRFVSLDPEGAMAPLIAVPLADFADTAFVMSRLDLVISVDTASAHLGGALGVPTWVLVADMPEWRWGAAAAGSPWYPDARLYRCGSPTAWPAIIAEVARDLAEAVSRPRARMRPADRR